MTWLSAIIEAMKALGGKGSLEDIYKKVEEIGHKKPSVNECLTWQNTIRQVIYDHSSDSDSFRTKVDIFCHLGHGIWGLRDNLSTIQTNKDFETDLGDSQSKDKNEETGNVKKDENMEKQEKKSFFINMRRDSGELRLMIVLFFTILAGAFLWAGYLLTKAGTSGKWEIVSSFKGWTLYITSISPGLFIVVLAAAIIIWGLPRVLKNL